MVWGLALSGNSRPHPPRMALGLLLLLLQPALAATEQWTVLDGVCPDYSSYAASWASYAGSFKTISECEAKCASHNCSTFTWNHRVNKCEGYVVPARVFPLSVALLADRQRATDPTAHTLITPTPPHHVHPYSHPHTVCATRPTTWSP